MMHTRLALAWVALTCGLSFAQSVQKPSEVLGFEPGTDGRLAGVEEIYGYLRQLAEASPRVRYTVLGQSTEGRDMVGLMITDPKNLERLEEIRAGNLALADPRGRDAAELEAALAQGRVIVAVNESIHSNEVGPAQASMVTAHFLATVQTPEWEKILQNVVVILVPCHNPDGYARVVEWWRKNENSPKHRGAPMPFLYHRYVGHDNNRDWFMLTQAESRVTVQSLYMPWRPQVVVDQHQMGSGGARMFVPPYLEPYEPHVHPLLRKGTESLGRYVVNAMAADGLSGVWCNQQFDAWTPARAFMHYHGGARILTEVASARGPDPIAKQAPPRGAASRATDDNPSPWPGGRWGLDDIVRYTSKGALHAIRHAGENREVWLGNFLTIHQDAISNPAGPAAYVVRSTPRIRCLDKLEDLLTLGGVESYRIHACATKTHEFPAESLVIEGGQPCFPFAQALLENVPYPEIRTRPGGPIRRPYDMTCHSLPALMDLDVVRVTTGETEVLRSGRIPGAVRDQNTQEGGLLDPRDEGALAEVLRLIATGVSVGRVPGQAPWTGPVGPGAFVVPPGQVELKVTPAPATDEQRAKALPMPARRIGVLWTWTANMDEGWTRFFFDHFGIPFRAVRPEDIRRGDLRSTLDVLVIPSVSEQDLSNGITAETLPGEYRGGLGSEGAAALLAFHRSGGDIIAWEDSVGYVASTLRLPVQVVRGRGLTQGVSNPPTRVSIPGSTLRVRLDLEHPIASGHQPTLPVFVSTPQVLAFLAQDSDLTVQFPVLYAEAAELVLGGFTEGAQVLAGRGAVAVCQGEESGRVVLFAFPPQFRCQTWATFRLLLNALLP